MQDGLRQGDGDNGPLAALTSTHGPTPEGVDLMAGYLIVAPTIKKLARARKKSQKTKSIREEKVMSRAGPTGSGLRAEGMGA